MSPVGFLYRLRCPPPQVSEHLSHSVHSVHSHVGPSVVVGVSVVVGAGGNSVTKSISSVVVSPSPSDGLVAGGVVVVVVEVVVVVSEIGVVVFVGGD